MTANIGPGPLELRSLGPDDVDALAALFAELAAPGVARWFNPHPFDRPAAESICRRRGRDQYYGVWHDQALAAYGMLRGWDDGYDVPSLGIAVRPAYQGRGLAHMFMLFLQTAAQVTGATRMRLTVQSENTRAVALYRRLGYDLRATETSSLEGFLELPRATP